MWNCIADQWSPINPQGKKQYDRQFLLRMQYSAECLEKPADLPWLPDVILNEVCYQGYAIRLFVYISMNLMIFCLLLKLDYVVSKLYLWKKKFHCFLCVSIVAHL